MVKYLLDDLFSSLSDETRRDILQRLLLGEYTVSRLAETYKISLPAVSKHLKVLETSGLIIKEKRGRQYFVRLAPIALQKATEHLQHYQTVLHSRLDSFSAYLRQTSLAQPQQESTSIFSPNKQQTIVVTTSLDASPETAWHAYTDPASIVKWWSIPGTQLIKAENDIKVGGSWRFVLRGADGHEYVLGGKYTALEYPHRMEYTDGPGEPDIPRPEAHVTITFEQLPGGVTLLTKESAATPAVHQLNATWLQAVGGN